MRSRSTLAGLVLVLVLVLIALIAPPLSAQDDPELPVYLKDRGTGVATSMFGTYIREGELIIYPFYEYYRDGNIEYSPDEFGLDDKTDFRGRYRAHEGLLFVGYGLTENLALELEAAGISAEFEKSPDDPTGVPALLKESGLGDVEAQLRWRWRREDAGKPELFNYFEVVFPTQKDKYLIGTQDWELKAGIGLIKGFSWGTLTLRGAVEYAAASTSEFDIGEIALEYLKRLSPSWRIYLGLEATQDELSVIPEAQWHVSRNVFIRLNSAFGVTSKATDWAPELGVVVTLPTRGGTQ